MKLKGYEVGKESFLDNYSNERNISRLILLTILIGYKVGFKPAGGIRQAKDALVWLSLMKEELGDEWT